MHIVCFENVMIRSILSLKHYFFLLLLKTDFVISTLSAPKFLYGDKQTQTSIATDYHAFLSLF